MEDEEAEALVSGTAKVLHIEELLDRPYISELLHVSEKHPYVMKYFLVKYPLAASDFISSGLWREMTSFLPHCLKGRTQP